MMINETIQPGIEDGFPPKPDARNNESALPKTLLSLALFILAYYYVFDKDIKRMIILIVVLFIHEMGHFLAMKYFRYSEVKMFFIPLLGALVTGDKQEISQRQRAIILLAGPVPGILIGAVLYFLGEKSGNRDLLITAAIFIFVNAANLLPLTPLDGGRLIETLFFHNKVLIGNIFTVLSALAITAIALKFEMYTLLIIPFAFLARYNQQAALERVRSNLKVQAIDYNKSFDALTNREYWLIREQIVTEFSAFRSVDPKRYEFSPRERQIIQQVRGIAEKQLIPDLNAGGIILFALIWFVFLALPLAGIALAFYQRTVHH